MRNNVLDVLREIGATRLIPDGRPREEARQRLREAIDREARASTQHHRRRYLIRGAGVAAVLASGVLLLSVLQVSTPNPAAALERLGSAAERGSAAPLGAAEFLYIRSSGHVTVGVADVSSGLSWSAIVPIQREVWAAPDGSGRLVEIRGEPRFLDQHARRAWLDAGSPGADLFSRTQDESYAPGELMIRVDLSPLSTDPGTLLQQIEERRVLPGPPGDLETLDIIVDLLRDGVGSPDVKGALFRAAAMLPCVTSADEVPDETGRVGVGVSCSQADRTVRFIFDPATGDILEEATSIGGRWESSLTYESRAVVSIHDAKLGRPLPMSRS